MAKENFNSPDDYERFATKTIKPWSPKNRTALVAAMAERWLPVYEAFSEKNDWGNPAAFRDAVESVWNYVAGNKLTKQDLKRHREILEVHTPHVDNFDCEDALAACQLVYSALDCCGRAENTTLTVMALTDAFEGLVPGIYEYPDELPPNAWQRPKIQKELESQLRLLKLIGSMTAIDTKEIGTLRKKLASTDLRGPRSPRAKGPRLLTNEAAFERYRERVAPFAVDKWPYSFDWLEDDPGMRGSIFRQWAARYSDRKLSIKRLGDVLARDALLARNSAHDAAVQGDPGWNEDARAWLVENYQDPDYGLDVDSPDTPHRYGPSFRKLCIEGKLGAVLKWVRYRPPAWLEENRRKKQGLTYTTPELGKRLSRKLSWQNTDDIDHPWATKVAGKTWRVRLNDFPDDLMYTLIINDAIIGSFHEWPKDWLRDA